MKHAQAGFLFLLALGLAAPAAAVDGGPLLLAQYQRTVECRSTNYRPNVCRVPWRDAQLVRQISGSACVRGRTWGMDQRGLWVNNGCSGFFGEARGRPQAVVGGGWHPGPDWEQAIRLRCSSRDFRYQMCQVDTGRGSGVVLERQHSNTRCVEGQNWGWNRAGVWVDRGCDATFLVNRRWR